MGGLDGGGVGGLAAARLMVNSATVAAEMRANVRPQQQRRRTGHRLVLDDFMTGAGAPTIESAVLGVAAMVSKLLTFILLDAR